MAFGKAVKGEGLDGLDDLFLDGNVDVAFGHAEAQLPCDGFHAFIGALEGHGTAQFVGFRSIETGNDHSHAENLFLEEGDTQSATEDRLESGMNTVDLLEAIATVEIGMDEVSHDWTGTDEGNLDGEIIEVSRLHDGESGHLRTGLDLKGACRIGTAEEVIGGGVIVGYVSEIDFLSALTADTETVFHGGEHAQAEEIHFHDAEVLAVVLVPLHDSPVGHGCGLEGDDGIQSVVTDDHASGVLAQMPGQGEGCLVEVEEWLETGVIGRHASLFEGICEDGGGFPRGAVSHRSS